MTLIEINKIIARGTLKVVGMGTAIIILWVVIVLVLEYRENRRK